MSSDPLSVPDLRRLHAFRFALRRFLRDVGEAARREGLEPQQYQLLLAVKTLSLDGRPTIRALADDLLIRHHTTVEMVDRLEARGYVYRVPSTTDRRAVHVDLTDLGEEVLQRLAKFSRQELESTGPEMVANLTEILATGRSEVSEAHVSDGARP